MSIYIGDKEIKDLKIGTTTPSAVYLGENKVRPSQPFTPGANTIYYFPFESDANDYSGNNYVLSSSGTQQTVGRLFNTAVTVNKATTGVVFASAWIKVNSRGSGYSSSKDSSSVFGNLPGYLDYRVYSYRNSNDTDSVTFSQSASSTLRKKVGATLGQWFHLVIYYSSTSGVYCFINGVKYTITTSTTYYTGYGDSSKNFIVNKATTKAIIELSDVICENAVRTDQQVINYFNATKSKYGVS